MEAYTITAEDMTVHANKTKDILINQLVKDGIIPQEKASEICKKYFMVVAKRSWISTLFSSSEDKGNLVFICTTQTQCR